MSANVESMFYVRETPWHGLGTKVITAPDSKGALIAAGLDWNVVQEPIYTSENELINGYKRMSAIQTVRYWAWSQIATKLYRTVKLFHLQMSFSGRASDMKQPKPPGRKESMAACPYAP